MFWPTQLLMGIYFSQFWRLYVCDQSTNMATALFWITDFWVYPHKEEGDKGTVLDRLCVCACVCVCVCTRMRSVAQWCPALRDSMDCSPPGYPVHEISQARILGCHFFHQGIFLTQGLNPCFLCLLHWQQILYQWRHLYPLP